MNTVYIELVQDGTNDYGWLIENCKAEDFFGKRGKVTKSAIRDFVTAHAQIAAENHPQSWETRTKVRVSQDEIKRAVEWIYTHFTTQ